MSDWDGPFELYYKFLIFFGVVGFAIVGGILWLIYW